MYFLVHDENDNIIGSGFTSDGTLFPNNIECSEAQASDSKQWRIDRSVTPPMIIAKLEADLLPAAKLAKINNISKLCRDYILSGFESDALGSLHHYPFEETDQNNLTASVLASTLPNLPVGWTTVFWCSDSLGVWALRPHTASQIQTVGLASKKMKEDAVIKNAALSEQISLATTLAEVAAIVW